MVSVPNPSPRLVLASISTSYRWLVSEKASQTLQANSAQLSYTHLSSRFVSDQVTLVAADTTAPKISFRNGS